MEKGHWNHHLVLGYQVRNALVLALLLTSDQSANQSELLMLNYKDAKNCFQFLRKLLLVNNFMASSATTEVLYDI